MHSKTMPKMKTTILFDLDDTLIDRKASIRKYATALQRDFTRDLDSSPTNTLAEVIISCDAGGYRSRLDVSVDMLEALPWKIRPTSTQLQAHWEEHFSVSSELRTHATELLDLLMSHQWTVGLVTNGSTIVQNRKIDALNIRSYFSAIVISGDIGIKKPLPEIFHHALNQLQSPTKGTWFVGDHPLNDIVGAANVGLTPIWMRGSHPWPVAHPLPKKQIDALDEIPSILGITDAAL